jgi:hypothetical protein
MVTMYVIWALSRAYSVETSSTSSNEICGWPWKALWNDVIEIHTIDLDSDEYTAQEIDKADDDVREARLRGRFRGIWRCYYWLA